MPVPSRNRYQQERQRSILEAGKPHNKSVQINYGRIEEVDEETHQVKVRLFNGNMVGSNPKVGDFIPVITDLSDILNKYGSLRVGLAVKVTWSGRVMSERAVAEVIGDEESGDWARQKKIDKGGVGAYRIFTPTTLI